MTVRYMNLPFTYLLTIALYYEKNVSATYIGPFTYVANLPSRRGLRSFCSDRQPPVHRSTVGSRAFSVAGPQVWNCLPPEVTSPPSLATFRTRDSRRFCSLSRIYCNSSYLIFLCLHTVYSGHSSALNTQATLKIHD